MRRLILLLICTACTRGSATPAAIADEAFVATIAALREAARHSGGDAGAYMATREQVFRQQGVSEQDLRAYVAAHSADLQHLADVWAAAHEAAASPDAR